MAKSGLKKIIEKRKSGGNPFALNLGSGDQRSADREWFEANPKRQCRVREVFPDEFPGKTYGAAQCAIIKKERDGRRKMPVFYPLSSCCDNDSFLLGFLAAMRDDGCPDDDASSRDGWLLGCMNKGKLAEGG